MRSLLTFLCLLPIVFCQHLQAQYIYTFAGNGYGASTGIGGYTGNGGLAYAAELNACSGVTFDGAGNVYIADRNNNVVRKVNTSGIISTFAGTGTAGYSGDNGPATLAKLNQPYGVASDAAGNVYIADYNNNVIRKVSTTGTITTYAGVGLPGYSGDIGPATAAGLNGPTGVAVDTTGNLFIADANNNVVREVMSGSIYTIAGTGTHGYSGDGDFAVNAKLYYPVSVAVDPYDQLYIADFNNHVVRKIDTLGKISTFAGNGTVGHSGDGHPATMANLHNPAGVSVYGFGNVYISDEGNNAIRMVNSSGIITTFAGTFTNGYTGDGGLAVVAELSSPKGIAADGLNRLYIADFDNNVIRLVSTLTATPNVPTGTGTEIKVYPNPSNGSFTIQVPGTGSDATITITDVLGRIIDTRTTPATPSMQTLTINSIPAGSYIVKINSGDNTYRQQVQVW